MRALLFLAAVLSLLASCVSKIEYTVTSPKGSETMKVAGLMGGSEAFETAAGMRWTGNRNKSFGQGAQALAAAAGSVAYGYAQQSANAVTKAANASAATTQQAKIAAQTEAARIAAQQATTSEAIKAGATVAPITVTAP